MLSQHLNSIHIKSTDLIPVHQPLQETPGERKRRRRMMSAAAVSNHQHYGLNANDVRGSAGKWNNYQPLKVRCHSCRKAGADGKRLRLCEQEPQGDSDWAWADAVPQLCNYTGDWQQPTPASVLLRSSTAEELPRCLLGNSTGEVCFQIRKYFQVLKKTVPLTVSCFMAGN